MYISLITLRAKLGSVIVIARLCVCLCLFVCRSTLLQSARSVFAACERFFINTKIAWAVVNAATLPFCPAHTTY